MNFLSFQNERINASKVITVILVHNTAVRIYFSLFGFSINFIINNLFIHYIVNVIGRTCPNEWTSLFLVNVHIVSVFEGVPCVILAVYLSCTTSYVRSTLLGTLFPLAPTAKSTFTQLTNALNR